MLLGVSAGLSPGGPVPHGPPAGHPCPKCNGTQGHRDDCLEAILDRFASHMRDHPPCRKVAGVVFRTQNGELLCPRGRRLLDKARALGIAQDEDYARAMGGPPGSARPT